MMYDVLIEVTSKGREGTLITVRIDEINERAAECQAAYMISDDYDGRVVSITPVEGSCPFCTDYQKTLELQQHYKKDGYIDVTGVALVDETYYDGSRTGKVTHQTMPLNFCPVCGTEFKQKKGDKINENN